MVPVMRRETGEYRSIKNMPIRQIRKLEKQSINIDPAKYRKLVSLVLNGKLPQKLLNLRQIKNH